MARLHLFIFSLVVLGNAVSSPVKISLRTSWPAPPPMIEALETVALENADSFFPLVDQLTNPKVYQSVQKLPPEGVYHAVLQLAAGNGLLDEHSTVGMNLALHSAIPKVEAFYNYYNDHHGENNGTACGSWVDWHGETICDLDALKTAVEGRTASRGSSPRLLPFDHTYPPLYRVLERPLHTAILYGSLSSANFRTLHSYLFSLSREPNTEVLYVFRHVPPQTRDQNARSYLSGYGVALNLKKTDYLAVDDRNSESNSKRRGATFVQGGSNEPQVDPILELMQNFPEPDASTSPKTPLTEAELDNLATKAIQLIANSTRPLSALVHLSQNFPKYASPLARRVVTNASVEEEVRANSLVTQPGAHAFWLNGATLADKDVNPFGLLRLVKKERETITSLTDLGITRKEALEVITHKDIANAQKNTAGALDGLFDASDRPEGGDVITWWNDIEKDQRYGRWPTSLHVLIRPMFGSLPPVRRNLWNLVILLDLSHPSSLSWMAGPMANMINNNIPIRFGIVPLLETEDGAKMARLFRHLMQRHGRKPTLAFLQQLSLFQPTDQSTIDWNLVQKHYTTFAQKVQIENAEDDSAALVPSLDDILSVGAGFAGFEERTKAYADRLGATLTTSNMGHAFLNGRHFNFDGGFMTLMQRELGTQMQYLQRQVYTGQLKDDAPGDELSTYFYDQPTTAERRNRYVYPTKSQGNLRIFHLPDLFSRTGFTAEPSSFVYPPETSVIPITFYVMADLDSKAGLQLIKEALSSMTPSSRSRTTFIHNPSNLVSETTTRPRSSWLLSHLISSQRLSKASPIQLLQALGLTEGLAVEDTQISFSHNDETFRVLTDGLELAQLDAARHAEYIKACRFVLREIGVRPGERAILANGRFVGPIEFDDFRASDFSLLESYEMKQRVEPVVKALEDVAPSSVGKDRESDAQLITMVSSVIAAIQQPDSSEIGLFDKPPAVRSMSYRLLQSSYTMFQLGDSSNALYHFAVVMNPLSDIAPRWSSLIEWLSHLPGVFIEVHLNPAPLKEMPLKTFYRYNLLPSLSFDTNGEEIQAHALFDDLPVEPIYTLAMDVPKSWLVRPREALYDLDNLQLGHLLPGDTSVAAVFDLDYLVIEGHAREEATNGAPRGLQLELDRSGRACTPIDDTQVVENLGYLQFKAEPGIFVLDIRKGRGREIFTLTSAGNEGWDSQTVADVGNEIALTSFEGLTLYPRVARLPGMENADVLDERKPERGVFGDVASRFRRITSLFKPKDAQTQEQAEINIFTVASGLLYERFASIMILSVLRNTQSSVKFWFIENFLSPSFLEFIPHMAKKYNFQYELVTYKWPSWLREQTEKQRIIWAYKILFLDVLFPMDLKKVIFVDADQIVRADLKELVDLNLQGAPYAYTPMGDDNKEMEAFRFWKTGYWKDFLRGLPYHISALYVIDLVRFRQLAAGDILRREYQALSADPNSLANLDQDLPNNLQHHIPIYSLHEDWLWCETWCSKDRLNRAKTIDLCQNPLTKEPKLSRARQIPEWEEYDAEIALFTRKLVEEGLIHSGMAAADANVLANVGAMPVTDNNDAEGITSDGRHGEVEEAKGQPRDEL